MTNPIQMMVALRGREDGNRTYSQNIKVNTKYFQKMEFNGIDFTSTITSVQKDNLVLEVYFLDEGT